ncbi:MAG: membrane protein insertase YidC [Oscillospiraceae bacterium]|nr:membrane protein insertase YidC [Oscillospiraceae bacterium]
MINIIAAPLGWLMRWLFELTGNYGLTIILFAAATKLIMLPLSIWVQKNSIKMVRLQPQVNEIAARYAGDKDKAAQEQLELYKKEKYRPLLGVVPMLIQIPIIVGLINVVYNPLKFLLRLSADTIDALSAAAASALGVETLGAAGQLITARMAQDSAYASAFSAVSGSGAREALAKINALDFRLFGLDLSQTPSLSEASWLLIVPALAALSSLLLSELQNRFNVLQKEQKRKSQTGMTLFLTLFSLAFAFLVPAAIGVYWAVGNLAAILIMFFVNALIPPKKYIDYEVLEASKKTLESAQRAQKQSGPTREQKKRAKADYKRFFSPDNEGKELVFYSVKNGFYRYYKDLIERILAESDIVIHYVTSDANDEVFSLASERFIPYYIEGNNLIYFFMKLDTELMVMTMPEIEKYYYKRSLVRKDIDYVYTFHAMVSTHMIYRTGAFDHYDTILCVGPHHTAEIRETERVYGLPEKRLVEFGYPLLDDLRESYELLEKKDSRFQVLIAPSHHDGNILDSCIDGVLNAVMGRGWRIIVRPHPQYMRHNSGRLAELAQRYSDCSDVEFETDFSTNDSLYTSDLMITDWSGISMEYSFTTLRPCLFINTPMKVLNPEYEKINLEPIQIKIRDKIGVSLNTDETQRLTDVINDIKNGRILTKDDIDKIVKDTVYNVGSKGAAGSDYIIGEINRRRSAGSNS